MAIDPRKLRPSDLCRLLNSTPLGEVISERQLYRHRSRAGFRIGDGKSVDLLRYVAWLVHERHAPKPESEGDPYETLKDRARARNAALSLAGRDIGEMPAVADSARRQLAVIDFRFFCETYFPLTFHLPWSPDHLKVIHTIEQAVLHGGLFAMAMPRGSGKALAVDTSLPTPGGWTTMGEVRVGDHLFDERGRPTQVVFATEVQSERPCYRVDFSDGESIVCDADHLWNVEDRYSRQNPVTLPTSTMAERYLLPDSRNRVSRRYRLPMTLPLQVPAAGLPIDPYTLGVWLGDGTSENAIVTLNADDAEFIAAVVRQSCFESASWRHWESHKGHSRVALLTGTGRSDSFRSRLRRLGVLSEKHIPQDYLRASVSQRMCLLQGLMDTDGSVRHGGQCEITIKPPRLAENVCELLASLGIKHAARQRYSSIDGKRYGPYTRINFHAHDDLAVFRLKRKQGRVPPRPKTRPLSSSRHIDSINRVESVPVRCIQVDSPSSLYLAGRKMVPTHNTTICECACIWAVLFGHREFVCLIGSNEGHAMDMLDSIKMEFDGNELLLADFPEVVFPIQCLDGIANRCSGQLFKGERTHIGWTAKEVVLPTIVESKASGAIIKVGGITGRIRGMKYKRADGKAVRPSLVVLDDPQTDESARSLSQCANREAILAGAVLGLAGPGKKISGIMPCTVIRPDDMADNILDRDKHPEWNGERTKMVYAFPTDEKLWDRYAELRAEGMRNGDGGKAATEFYREHREEMDAGAVIAWEERFNHDELSAIQHAMNLKLQDEAAFFAEYQNEPLPTETTDDDLLTVDEIAAKTNRIGRGEIPIGCNALTMFIDVQQNLLFFVIIAWEDNFTGYVVDYGSYPDQKRTYFTLRDARHTLATVAEGTGLEGSIYAGLETLTKDLLSREWKRDDGAAMRVDRCLIDANWGHSTDVVYQFCRQSAHAAILTPSHGRFVGASSVPFSDYKRKQGDRVGLNWRIPNVRGKRAVRHVVYDTNYWKSFMHARLAVAMGDPGCLSLFGDKPDLHRLFAEHITAEYRVKTEGRGRTVDEWKIRPERADNHWLDGIVGCAVAASIQGVVLFGTDGTSASRHPRIKLSDLQRSKR